LTPLIVPVAGRAYLGGAFDVDDPSAATADQDPQFVESVRC
jgi:hypothetical protein